MKYEAPYGTEEESPYINGNPSIGLAGSIPPAAAIEHPQREIVHAIEKALLSPINTDLYQLLKAVRTQYFNWAVDLGIVNNLSCMFDPPLDDYNNGFVVRIKAAQTNTGEAQIDCGPGFRSVVRIDGSPLSAGDIQQGGVAVMCYVDGVFQLLNPNIASMIEAAMVSGEPGPPGSGVEIVQYITNQYAGFQAIQAWENPGTYDWTVPAGVRKIHCRLWAGGGPGIESSQSGAYIKGGDGGYVEGIFDVVPGDTMRVVVGAGANPPVPETDGNISYNASKWKTTYGQPSSFGVVGSPALCSASGGRGCYPNPPGDTDPSPGEPGVGTGGILTRANGTYGKGGGWNHTSDGVHDDWIECTGENGACILMY